MSLNTDSFNSMSKAQRMAVMSSVDAGVKSVSEDLFKPLTGIDENMIKAQQAAAQNPNNKSTVSDMRTTQCVK